MIELFTDRRGSRLYQQRSAESVPRNLRLLRRVEDRHGRRNGSGSRLCHHSFSLDGGSSLPFYSGAVERGVSPVRSFLSWIIAALVQFVEMALKKYSHALYEALGVYLPLITTNCAVLGVALINVQRNYSILEGVVYGFATAAGFFIAIVLMAGIREKIEDNDIPESFKGTPIVLLTACLMAIAFFGFSGLK